MKFKSKKYFIWILLPILIFILLFINYISLYSNKKFNDYVVFYPQHQDDEILWAGSAILNAINERGNNHVFIVLISNGSGSYIFDKYDKYKDLTIEEKREIRNKEFLSSVEALGIKKENVLILSDKNPSNSSDFNLMKETALSFEKKYKSVTHIAHTYKYDNHPQHLKNGLVIKSLYDNGYIKDARFFIKPKFVYHVPKNILEIYYIISNKDLNKIKNSCNQYKIIDESIGREGIGYKSDNKSFDALLNDFHAKSYLHHLDI
ncbi:MULTISPECIES: PIG-L family deacetylase [unclassified Romboutsia]|uniref:PIG-L family deacetylase n=1 Tax=unclassified Romboutsia TaxID=2626894 RepID=UPI000822D9AD|nr:MULTISPECIES: PIG-L family deacetylase [unclassified Romboutsia]SCH53393.1 Uncharacterized proteins%2C LmbE homologs [uncultured Clostridium sp.]